MDGLKFRRQQPLGPFIADFFCAELRLVLEIDGGIHETVEQKAKDLARDEWMRSQGLRIARIRTRELSEISLRKVILAFRDLLPESDGNGRP